MGYEEWSANEEIQYLRDYLRIPTVHPDPDYAPAVEFIKRQAEELQLPVSIFHPFDGKNPIVIITWEGDQPDLPSIFLNSHMDVVPVFPENWSRAPFSADMDVCGNIYARGAQDMKCVGAWYMAAIRALKCSGSRFKRTIHICFVPDEEMGGRRGMRPFIDTEDFRKLNVGCGLDEGMASTGEAIPVYYGERTVWRMTFKASGQAGHGSLLLGNTAGEKIQYIINKMMALRQSQVDRLRSDKNLRIGDVTTVNLTRLGGGIQSNVIPPMLTAGFDTRLAIDVDLEKQEDQFQKWCAEAGGGIEIEFDQKHPFVKPSSICCSNNPFWATFKKATTDLGLTIEPQIFNGGTDSRYLRRVGIPAYGFSPLHHHPVLLHDHNEFINANVYLKGIEIYKRVISDLANVDG
ncbi:aminoacylase-1-like [Drosophila sulfurigaster albostrigata]|uniref:aminoacylase-1-like n=1 Tax=Drosophila sulfurigaster albostrigata TaxID=89887 RepID=UPI002D21C794|nr:aminoacylase-1-like [Drosophila sulfurigaster albostrigata]XP_062138260.1 aminoacylase-1-like [Drosophila sulfurigaster albostrigata]